MSLFIRHCFHIFPYLAAFDPIFYLHHANVDRMLALWSAVNPGVWVVDGPGVGETVGIETGSYSDIITHLSV